MTGIKETQILKRISVRWLPDPAYEDSVTISLNVGGWYMDLRVATADGSLQWSRAGERKTLRQEPRTFIMSFVEGWGQSCLAFISSHQSIRVAQRLTDISRK
jgi:hypothetical protein